jgi:hypothetical protein
MALATDDASSTALQRLHQADIIKKGAQSAKRFCFAFPGMAWLGH